MSSISTTRNSMNEVDPGSVNIAKQINLLKTQVGEMHTALGALRVEMEGFQGRFDALIHLVNSQTAFLKQTLPSSPWQLPGDAVLFCSSCQREKSIFMNRQIKKEERGTNQFIWKIICPTCKESDLETAQAPLEQEKEMVQTLIEQLTERSLLKTK